MRGGTNIFPLPSPSTPGESIAQRRRLKRIEQAKYKLLECGLPKRWMAEQMGETLATFHVDGLTADQCNWLISAAVRAGLIEDPRFNSKRKPYRRDS